MKKLSLLILIFLIPFFAISQKVKTYTSLDDAMENPDLVVELKLSNTGLSNIPEEIKNFKNLESLILYDNQITHIPHWVKEMTNLKNIYLGGNAKLDSLTNLESMTWIEGLDFSNMGLKEIPGFIFNFKELDYLKMTENKIKNLPSELNNLQNLKVLNLSYNKVKLFPEYILLESLTQLFLHSNPVKSIPSSIGKMTNLIELYIGSTKIKDLPIELLEISTLSHIDATNSKIKSEKFVELKSKNTKIFWD